MKAKATKRNSAAAGSLHGEGHSSKISKTIAAAVGVASAHHASAAAGASNLAASKAAKQLLALQIDAQEKALKLMKKLAAQRDPAKKALLQHKLDKLLSTAAAAAAAAAVAPSGAASSAAAAGHSGAVAVVRKEHRAQPLAGITSVLANTPAEQARRAERQQRFAADLAAMHQPSSSNSSSILNHQDEAIGAVGGWLALGGGYGSSMSLEKEYHLRLTCVPKAEDVRPPAVLAQSLALIKRRWREGCSYAWACSQLKSVRQDLTVQGVADELAVDAYETHARVSLESNDLPEFRQCLARLKQLYRAGVPGCAAEFYSYGVLHAAALGPLLLNQELGQLPRTQLEHASIVHALATARAVRSGAYCSFMGLYASAPRMAPYLMDALLPRVRAQGLSTLLAAHHPSRLPLHWTMAQLGWEADQEHEALEYLAQQGAVVDVAAREIDTRASRAAAAKR